MAEKPKFDPSKPFEAVSKPKFDPGQPFEAPSQAPTQSNIIDGQKYSMGSGRAAGSFAVGAAEALNPLPLIRGIEVLGRTAIKSLDPKNKGFLATIEEASKEAKVPEMNLSQLSAALRTGVQAPFSDKKLPEIYSQEIKSQEQFMSSLNQPARMAGSAATILASLPETIKNVSKLMGATPKAAQSLANEAAVNALKPIGQKGKQLLSDAEEVQRIGKTLRDEKIVTAGASFKDILNRTAQKLEDFGATVGHYSKSADAALARDSSVRGVPVDEIVSRVQNSVIPKLIEEGNADVAKKVSDWLVSNLKPAAGGMPDIGFQQMQNIKKTLANTKASFDAIRDTNASTAFQQVWGIMNDAHVSGIESALKKAGSTDDIKEFLKAKNAYSDLKTAQKYITDTVGRMAQNRALSPTDYAAGLGGLMMRAGAGDMAALLQAAGMAGANKATRLRGNQLATGLYGAIANKLAEPTKSIPGIAGAIGTSKLLIPNEKGGQ